MRTEILAMLEAELGLQYRHLELLVQQKDALVTLNRAAFAVLHDQHETLLRQMELQSAQRAKLLPRDRAWLLTETSLWPEIDRETFMSTMIALKKVVHEVRSQSAQNQTLIANDLRYLDFEMNLIINSAKTGARYIKSGVAVALQPNRLINQMA